MPDVIKNKYKCDINISVNYDYDYCHSRSKIIRKRINELEKELEKRYNLLTKIFKKINLNLENISISDIDILINTNTCNDVNTLLKNSLFALINDENFKVLEEMCGK